MAKAGPHEAKSLVVKTDLVVVLQRVGEKIRVYVTDGEGNNVKGAYVHAATDAVQSAAVVAVGIAMWLTGWWLLDPIVSLAIAVLIARLRAVRSTTPSPACRSANTTG